MAKLYAEITSDKGGRKVSKGGEKFVQCVFTNKGKITLTVAQLSDTTVLYDKKGDHLMTIHNS